MSPEDMKNWVCPNDRQLTLRAKLGTGWSFHTGRSNRSRPEQLTGEEMDHIIRVVKRSELLEETEKRRIGTLVDRVENMKNLASGNGKSQCLLCALEFTILNRSSSRTCDDCSMVVCSKCGVDTVLHHCQQQLWLCKICSEKRELWKRSGAWFYNSLPNYVVSKCKDPMCDALSKPPIESPNRNENGKSGGPETSSSRTENITTTWTRVKPRRHSSTSSGSEYSIDGNDAPLPGEPVPEALSQINVCTPEPCADDPAPSPVLPPPSPPPSLPNPRSASLPNPASSATPQPFSSSTLAPEGPQRTGGFRSSTPPVTSKSGKMTLLAKAQRRQNSISSTEEDKEEDKPEPIKETGVIKVPGLSEFGYLEYSVYYNATNSQLTVKIIRATDLKPMDPNGLSDPYVKLHLLPGGDHRTKLRTRTIHKCLNPVWNEELVYYGLTVADMLRKSLRFSVLDEDMMGFDWIGEYRQPLQEIATNCQLHLMVPLQFPRKLLPREVNNKNTRGRIFIALCLNQANDTIVINILRCAELLAKDSNGYSDPYVKVRLLPDPQKKNKRKTSVKLKTLNPSYNEEFKFKIDDPKSAIGSTLDIKVYDYDFGAKDDYIGGIQIGLNSRGELLRHWYDMFKYPNKRLERWHPLAKLKH